LLKKKLMLFDLKTPIRQAFWGFLLNYYRYCV